MAQKTSGKFTTPLMILAFISAAALMYWLSVVSEPTEFTVATEEPAGAVQDIGPAELAGNATGYVDQPVRLAPVLVTDSSNPDAVWFQLEDVTPYLVRLPRPLVDGGLRILEGEAVAFGGHVRMMSDSVLDAWTAEGVITDDATRERMGTVQTFFEAVAADIQGRPEAEASES